MADWQIEENVACVSCPECAFTFDAFHTVADGTAYTCPCCNELRLERQAEQLAAALRMLLVFLDDPNETPAEILDRIERDARAALAAYEEHG